jgi:hypothetical protein
MVQECFIQQWRTAARFEVDRGTVAAHLLVIAGSVAADIRKHPSSRPLVPVEDALCRPGSTAWTGFLKA